jgi:dTDP-4-amino-4,6-dideoxygalactose transaminase
VLTSPITFIATLNALFHAGCQVSLAEEEMKGPVIMPVHLGGVPCEFEGRYVIEDACHALGSEHKYGFVGDCHASDACVFSTHAIKNIATGEGGIVTTNDEYIRDWLIEIRDHGRGPDGHYKSLRGWNFRLSCIHAALGLSQLQSLLERRSHRMEISEMYSEGLQGFVDVPHLPQYPVFWHAYIIHTEGRDKLMEDLKAQDIESRVLYPCVYKHPAWKDYFHGVEIPWAEEWERTALAIPMHNNLSDKDVATVIEAVKRSVG